MPSQMDVLVVALTVLVHAVAVSCLEAPFTFRVLAPGVESAAALSSFHEGGFIGGIVAAQDSASGQTQVALWRLPSDEDVRTAAEEVCRVISHSPQAGSAGRLLPSLPASEDSNSRQGHPALPDSSLAARWYTVNGINGILPASVFFSVERSGENSSILVNPLQRIIPAWSPDLQELFVECWKQESLLPGKREEQDQQLPQREWRRAAFAQGTPTVMPSNYFIITVAGFPSRFWIRLLISRFVNITSKRVFINVENASAPEVNTFDYESATNYNFSILDDAQIPFNTSSASGDEWALDLPTSTAVAKLQGLEGRSLASLLGASALFVHVPWARPKPCMLEWTIDSNSSLLQGRFGLVKAGPRGSSAAEKSTVCSEEINPFNFYSITRSRRPMASFQDLGENWTTTTSQFSKLVCNAGNTKYNKTLLIPSFLSTLRDETTVKNVQCPDDAATLADCTYEDPRGGCTHYLDVGAMCGTNLLPEYPPIVVNFLTGNLTWAHVNESFRRIETVYGIPFSRINLTGLYNASTTNVSIYCDDPKSISYWPEVCGGCSNTTTAGQNPFCYLSGSFTIAYDPLVDGPSAEFFNVTESSALLSTNEHTIHDLNLLLSYMDPTVMSLVAGWNYGYFWSLNGTVNGVFMPSQQVYYPVYYPGNAFQPLLPPPSTATQQQVIQQRCATKTKSLQPPTLAPSTAVPPTRSLAPGSTAAPSTSKPTQVPPSVVPLAIPPQHFSSSSSFQAGSGATPLVATTGGIVVTVLVAAIVLAVVFVCWLKRTSTSDGVGTGSSGKQTLFSSVEQRGGTELWDLEDPFTGVSPGTTGAAASKATKGGSQLLAGKKNAKREQQESSSDSDESIIL